MKKATLAQRNKLWKIVQENGTSCEQMQQLLASGLLSDLLDANFNEPINRSAHRRSLGLKPLHVDALSTPLMDLLERCRERNIRLYWGLRNISPLCDMGSTATIGELAAYIAEHPISRMKNLHGKSVIATKELFLEFGIELAVSERDEDAVRQYLRASETRSQPLDLQ